MTFNDRMSPFGLNPVWFMECNLSLISYLSIYLRTPSQIVFSKESDGERGSQLIIAMHT